MFALITVDSLYYHAPLRTFSTHEAAFKAGAALGGWWDIERIL